MPKPPESLRKFLFFTIVSTITASAMASGVFASPLNQSADTVTVPLPVQTKLPWMDTTLSPEVRSKLLINAMTLDQKIQQLAGTPGEIPELKECGKPIRHVTGIPELGIPTFRVTNGPAGIGLNDCCPGDKATALPSALGLAASFDPDLAYSFGDLMAGEARTLGLHLIEAPAINLVRTGKGGRNFEYMGEDPYLAGTMAAKEIQGIQDNGIIAMPKHYLLNEQEKYRRRVNVNIAENVLHELYLLPFEMSIKDGGASSIMCSYNRVRGTYSCENDELLNTILRGELGFKGFVQSDFGAVHSSAPALNAGLDLEMPSAHFFAKSQIKAALSNGILSLNTIDRALYRRYVQMFKYGIFDRPIVRGTIDAKANGSKARDIAEQTAVLLKNNGGLLPLKPSIKSIALIGRAAYLDGAVTGGRGSSQVNPLYTVTPLQGLQNALAKIGSTAKITKVTVDKDNRNLDEAVAAAKNADAVILMAGVITSEAVDRKVLSLPHNQDAMISAIAAANKKTILVLKDSNPVLMPWIKEVPAILEAWYPGEEDGNAVANLLVGLATPSGKLPVTYPASKADTPTDTPRRYPGIKTKVTDSSGKKIPQVYYSEGLEMGYRWYDSRGIKSLFAFGHGLSYTNFTISGPAVAPKTTDGTQSIRISFFVKNTGDAVGAEVPQVYLGLPKEANEPPKRLVGFKKIWLKPGEERQVTLTIDPAASNHPLSIWDSSSDRWKILDGVYKVYLGSASDHITFTDSITVKTGGGSKR